MEILPLTPSCKAAFTEKEHICFGISPFNSLFSQEYLEKLAVLGKESFESFHFFVPDEPCIHTLLALGYGPEKAKRKLRKQINWLKNKIKKAFEKTGVGSEQCLLDWACLENNEEFQKERAKVDNLFDSDHRFREICIDSSRWVLQNKLPANEMSQDRLLTAVKYFLAEVPLFSAANKIVGRSNSVFCYHQSIEFHANFYAGELACRPSHGQGFGVINA